MPTGVCVVLMWCRAGEDVVRSMSMGDVKVRDDGIL